MRAERFFVLPFAIGCDSDASVAVGKTDDQHLRATKPNDEPETMLVFVSQERRGARESSSSVMTKSKKTGFGFLNLPKPGNISSGIQRLIRSIKNLSRVFGYKEEIEEEEEEREMEIGFPTDVKHVTHIGFDGSKTTNVVKAWEDLDAPESLSLPLSSVSLQQFERAMAAQSCTLDLGKV